MPEAKSNKRYKLHAVSGDGEKKLCAFFASDKGCRNGASCKFAHEFPNEKKVEDIAVSSESSDDEEESVIKKEDKDVVSPFPAEEAKKVSTKKKANHRNDNPFANPKSKKQKISSDESTPPPKEKKTKKTKSSSTSDFRSLDLPIASFSALSKNENEPVEEKKEVQKIEPEPEPNETKPNLPLPTSSAAGKKWIEIIEKVRAHPRYERNYDMEKYKQMDEEAGYSSNTWVKTAPYTKDKANNPQIIAMDCEMCETQDPVSGQKDPRSLCRVSIVDVEKDEVLLDTLVKPMWPVTDYRSWINGIDESHMENVQFTLRHAQAFLMALCSEETVMIGHAVHNDLAALRVEHPTVVDTACLYSAADSETATVALRDLVGHLLKKDMPEKHDSVNDARCSFKCAEHYRVNDGKVDKIPRTPKPGGPTNSNDNKERKTIADYANKLFIHRIPKKGIDTVHLKEMFLSYTTIQPVQIDEIDYESGNLGKTYVHFKTENHARLAFDTLTGRADSENSGRLQKKVFLKDGDYVRVRKMEFERKDPSLKRRESA